MTSVLSIVVPYVKYILYVWGKFANFDEFYNGYERREQLWLKVVLVI